VKAVIVGCGRVGSALAKRLDGAGWHVAVIDEREEALELLGDRWGGDFVLGQGIDADVLERAGVPDADAVIAATDGDNTNIVVSQIARRRYGVERVVTRILDPARAEFYASRGLAVVSPTRTAIEDLSRWALAAAEDD
jgi:trk system potassium uptake protein TrkA